jgi:hypothetical protein
MFMGTYIMLDMQKVIGKYYIIVVVIFAGVWCFKSYKQLGHYHKPQKYVSEVQCFIVFWVRSE